MVRRTRTALWTAELAVLLAAVLALAACVPVQPDDPAPARPVASAERSVDDPAPPAPSSPARPEPAPREPTPAAPEVPEPADDERLAWYYTPNTSHTVVAVPSRASELLAAYSGIYTGPDPGAVYLTFDQGYENGNTPVILDALARGGVKATFFLTETYIRANPELVRRMADEGHLVGNHTATHPSLPSLVDDPEAFARELETTEATYAEVTGREMARIMRPPMGEYSARSLWRTQRLGYTSVFWGFAHRDWIVDDQPPVDVTIERILNGSHPGAIYLLHGVSSSDAQALDDAIEGLRAQGYRFGVL
jgi:peptidoglycan-N-acetylmuramic acid deacetylase